MYSPPTKKVTFASPETPRERQAFPSKGFREDREYVHAPAAHCNIVSQQILEAQPACYFWQKTKK